MKFGIIGYGAIGKLYAEIIAKRDDLHLISVCDTDQSISQINEAVEHYEDYKTMILSSDLDAVIVAAPNYLHAPASLFALQHGRHVLCEKPMAINIRDAEQMVQKSKDTGKALFVPHHFRYSDEVVKFYELFNNGHVGDIVYVNSMFCERWLNAPDWYYQREKSGGGTLIDNGINAINLLIPVVGYPKILKADFKFHLPGIDSKAVVYFSFNKSDNPNGFLMASWDDHEIRLTTIINNKGDIYLLNHKYDEFFVNGKRIPTLKDASKMEGYQSVSGLETALHLEYERIVDHFVKGASAGNINSELSFLSLKFVLESYGLARNSF